MADPDRPLFADAKHQAARLAADFQEMASLRWELARLEFEEAVKSVRQLVIRAVVAATMGLTALPILAVWLAEYLDGTTALARAEWLLIFGLGLTAGAAVVGGLAWRRSRRFTALEETLEECREDLVWLQEWLAQSEQDEEEPETSG